MAFESVQPASYRTGWSNLSVFHSFEKRRFLAAPALSTIIGKVLDRYDVDNGTTFEIGAGGGGLRTLAVATTERNPWIESDHRSDILELDRPFPQASVVAAMPDLPLGTGSTDTIVGLSALDTFSHTDLLQTAHESFRALRSGGHFIHFLDMAPDILAEVRSSRQTGEFPMAIVGENGELGLAYLALKNLPAKIGRLDVDPAVKRVFADIVQNPEQAIPQANGTAIPAYLGQLLVEEFPYLIERTVDSWFDLFGRRLSDVFDAAGFNAIEFAPVTDCALIDTESLPARYRQLKNLYFKRDLGMNVKQLKMPPGVVPAGKALTEATLQVFVATK